MLLGAGDGTFAPERRIAAGQAPLLVELGDLGKDGDDDIVFSDFGFQSTGVGVRLSLGDGSFGPAVRTGDFANDNPVEPITLADRKGDDDDDLDAVGVNADGCGLSMSSRS